MLIRNLRRHNRKGVILSSWGILGQNRHNHVNNHANDYYIVNVMSKLGYDYDIPLSEKLCNNKDGKYIMRGLWRPWWLQLHFGHSASIRFELRTRSIFLLQPTIVSIQSAD